MNPVEKAQALLQLDPLPIDIEDQIDALYDQANEIERIEFVGIYEALTVALLKV